MTTEDEFDAYFARAITHPPPVLFSDCRRESLPELQALRVDRQRRGSRFPSGTDQRRDSGKTPTRTASCKYPQRYRRRSSASPREGSTGPTARRSLAGISQGQISPGSRGSSTRVSCPCRDGLLLVPSPSRQKSRSAPHSRSSSWKRVKRTHNSRDQLSSCAECSSRSRSDSVTLEETISAKLNELKLLQAQNCCVVRQFSRASRGRIVNRGDSFKRKARYHSSDQIARSRGGVDARGAREGLYEESGKGANRVEAEVEILMAKSVTDSSLARRASEERVRVVVLGEEGVGKTALLQQFMTSQFMAAEQTNFEAECEKLVMVCLDEEDTLLEFHERPASEHLHGCLGSLMDEGVQIYLLVYSITDRQSFNYISLVVDELRQHHVTDPVLLAANKSDLVRTRQVTREESQSLCQQVGCRQVEVSAALNHQVDELLVSLVTTYRSATTRYLANDTDRNCVRSAADLLKGLFKRQRTSSLSRSCDNLIKFDNHIINVVKS